MIRAISTVLSFTHGFVLNETGQRRRQLPSCDLRITRMLNESSPDPDTEFAWQLDRVLDGLTTATRSTRH